MAVLDVLQVEGISFAIAEHPRRNFTPARFLKHSLVRKIRMICLGESEKKGEARKRGQAISM